MANDGITISTDGEKDSRFVEKRRSNVKSDLIEITEDKLENILLKHVHLLELRKRWLLPLSFLVSVVLTLSSATFRDALGMNADSWQAIFVVIAVISSVWLVSELVQLARCWSKTTLEYLIALIKNAQ